MTTPEMHVMFRQYAQQMGMQNVRAILPEQIDLLLNTSIMDITNQIIKENIGITNDRVITDNSKIGQINALRSLYHVHYIEMSPVPSQLEEKRTFSFSAADRNTGRMTTDFKRVSDNNLLPEYMFLVDFSLNYKKVINGQGYNGKTGVSIKGTYNVLTPQGCITASEEYLIKNKSLTTDIIIEVYSVDSESFVNLTFAVDTSVTNNPRLKCKSEGYTTYFLGVEGTNSQHSSYGGKHYVLTKTFTDGDTDYNDGIIYNPLVINSSVLTSEYVAPAFETDGVETNYFPVRLIDDAYLADTLNDFVLKNRLRSPILVTYNNNSNKNVFDLYIDKFSKTTEGRYVLEGGLIPYMLRMSYIGKPVKVKYGEDIGQENVDCDLPEYTHVDVVKHAVDLYRVALNGSMMAAKQQEQNASQENVRNNYRNEGNAQ